MTLDQALNSIPIGSELPIPLPAGHVSKTRNIDSILSHDKIIPQHSKDLTENLIFLSYGGLFHRPSERPTKDETEMPIAFLFSPRVLTLAKRYYPFDTGAMFSGRFGIWSNRLMSSWHDYQVLSHRDVTTPSKIVYSIYRTNRRYLVGSAQVDCMNLPEPFPEICEFLSTDLTFLGVDHRQSTIECQLDKPIQLSKYLMWIGLPEWRSDILSKLYQLTKPDVPHYYSYSSHKITKPSEIVAQLQIKAAEEIERFLVLSGE